MRVLIACEFSGAVREAFAKLGHDVWSCDLLPSEKNGKHFQGDVLDLIYQDKREQNFKGVPHSWDLMIAHPPCTHLAVSGAAWFKYKKKEQGEALAFIQNLLDAPIEKIALENPVGVISTRIRKPDQIIQPYQFGDSFSKKTCLWLKNLPKLVPTKIVNKGEFITYKSGRKMPKWYAELRGKGHERSRTFKGIAEAMAKQWGNLEGGSSHSSHS